MKTSNDFRNEFQAATDAMRLSILAAAVAMSGGAAYMQRLRDEGATDFHVLTQVLTRMHSKDAIEGMIRELLGDCMPFGTKGSAARFLGEMIAR